MGGSNTNQLNYPCYLLYIPFFLAKWVVTLQLLRKKTRIQRLSRFVLPWTSVGCFKNPAKNHLFFYFGNPVNNASKNQPTNLPQLGFRNQQQAVASPRQGVDLDHLQELGNFLFSSQSMALSVEVWRSQKRGMWLVVKCRAGGWVIDGFG